MVDRLIVVFGIIILVNVLAFGPMVIQMKSSEEAMPQVSNVSIALDNGSEVMKTTDEGSQNLSSEVPNISSVSSEESHVLPIEQVVVTKLMMKNMRVGHFP